MPLPGAGQLATRPSLNERGVEVNTNHRPNTSCCPDLLTSGDAIASLRPQSVGSRSVGRSALSDLATGGDKGGGAMSDAWSEESSMDERAAYLLNRGALLRRGAAGALGVSALPALLGSAPAWAAEAAGTVTVGSNASDAVPKKAYQTIYDAFAKSSGTQVKVNT